MMENYKLQKPRGLALVWKKPHPSQSAIAARWKRWLHRHGWSLPAPALMILGACLWFLLYEDRYEVSVRLPQSGAELIYARVYSDPFKYIQHREIEITGALPATIIHPNTGGAREIYVSEGTDPDTGHSLVVVRDWLASVWIDLDRQCVEHSWQPSPITPSRRNCDPPLYAINATLRDVGVIINAAIGEPAFVKGNIEDGE